jgi:hypothetical protein
MIMWTGVMKMEHGSIMRESQNASRPPRQVEATLRARRGMFAVMAEVSVE